MTVFVVTEGEYSDYHIEGIFSTKELATKYIENKKQTDYSEYWEPSIEKWEMDKLQDLVAEEVFRLEIDTKNGNLLESSKSRMLIIEHSRGRVEYANRRAICAISIVSEEHALKLAAEARQEFLRAGETKDAQMD